MAKLNIIINIHVNGIPEDEFEVSVDTIDENSETAGEIGEFASMDDNDDDDADEE